MATAQRMTFANLLTQPDDGYRYELVRGEILRMPPTKGAPKNIEATLVGAIDRYLYHRAVDLGRAPEHGRTARYSLVGYLGSGDGGARMVWQLYPSTRTVRVFRSDNSTWTVTIAGSLDGGDILPGFSMSVRELLA